jgi:hypothetical protein
VNGRTVFGQTKTYRARKTRIPDFLVEEFRAHLETVDPAPCVLLFAAPKGGPLRIANFRQRVWWPALDAAPTSSTTSCLALTSFIRTRPAELAKRVRHTVGFVVDPTS